MSSADVQITLMLGMAHISTGTRADIVMSAYKAGAKPSDDHILPVFRDSPHWLAAVLRCAYENGLEPSDRHFEPLVPSAATKTLIKYATSAKLAKQYNRLRYNTDWELHIQRMTTRSRAELLLDAYRKLDIEPDFVNHVRPLLPGYGWAALLAAYNLGLEPVMEHVPNFKVFAASQYDGQVRVDVETLAFRERLAMGKLLVIWFNCGLVKSLQGIYIDCLGSQRACANVLQAAYASGVVPQQSHLYKYSTIPAGIIKKARQSYVWRALAQRKCAELFLGKDVASLVIDIVRSRDM